MKTTMKKIIAAAGAIALGGGLSAATLGSTYIEAGIGYQRFDNGAHTFDLKGAEVTANVGLFDIGPVGLDVKGSYEDYRDTSDSAGDVKLRNASVEAVAHLSLLGFLRPYVSAGGIWAWTETPAGSGVGAIDENKGGYLAEIGVDVTLIPKLWEARPSIQYVDAGERRSVSYSLGTTVWISIVGIGASVAYEDYQDIGASNTKALLYARVRF